MISANTLFHFTSSIDNLRSILTNHFSPRYSLENIGFLSKKESIDIAIPMVCFCDIPLSQIIDHVNVYGEYAVGLTKDWAIRNGISPILYLYFESNTMKFIPEFFKTSTIFAKIRKEISGKDSNSEVKSLLRFMCHCKDYEGSMWRNGEKIDRVLYNENEWRYVPYLDPLEYPDLELFITSKIFNSKETMNQFNTRLSNCKIVFTPNDIKYIVISKESERSDFIKMIELVKGSDYNPDELKLLNSKIISVENIKEDF